MPGSPVEYEDDVTYTCKGCGEILEEGKAFELEDLAILTGDQAFCAGCFRCRNCKRKIENLRYARTSQGIFCMNCHELLMARRKKKQKSARQAAHNTPGPSPMLALDKSLPAIPQDLDDDDRRSGFSETPTELSPRPSRPAMQSRSTSNTIKSELSPTYPDTQRLPRPYNSNRHSQIYHHPDLPELGGNEIEPYSFIPLVLDSSPLAPLPNTSYRADSTNDSLASRKDRPAPPRTYSNTTEIQMDHEPDRYDTLGRKPVPAAQLGNHPPHIAYQEKGRQPSQPIPPDAERKSLDKKPVNTSNEASPYPSRTSSRAAPADISPSKTTTLDVENKQWYDNFKLQEVPRERKRSVTSSPTVPNLDDISISFSPMRTGPEPQIDFSKQSSSQETGQKQQLDNSQDESVSSPGKISSIFSHTSDSSSSGNTTLDAPEMTSSISRKEVPTRVPLSSERISSQENRVERQLPYSKPALTPLILPADPRPPPLPARPNATAHKSSQSESLGVSLSDTPLLSLSLRTPVGDFSQDEDIARILGSDSSSPMLLRKMSNAVRHGRSFSDLAVTAESKEENAVLKNELRKSTMKIAELEMKLTVNGNNAPVDSSKIEEQKSVMAKLHSEREVRIRELEILAASKEGRDFETLRKDAIRNLAKELEDLRNSYEAQIQALSIQKNNLLEEVAKLNRIRDQTIQDTEQLNLKNAQLMDLNNEITRQIQGKFQSNKGNFSAPNGLGILNKDGSDLVDYQRDRIQAGGSSTTGAGSHGEGEDEDVIIAQPTIVNVGRKGNYIKKSWKKGGAAIIKGAGKGFNKVFSTDSPGHSNHQQGLQGTQYELTSSLLPPNTEGHLARSATAPDPHGGFDKILTQKFRMNKKGASQGGNSGEKDKNNNGSFTAINSSGLLTQQKDDVAVPLFGSELEVRAAFEGKSIPYIVSRCIQEVEARGMDFEGIYRKSGGASSMRQIQDAFERGEELDIGDSVDICGVTSVLKQYFRKLPTPIITPAIYDDFLKTTRLTNDEQRVQEIKNIMSQLSMVHQDVLGYVIFHLRKVAEKESKNLMTTRNLAVVFAPTLMWHHDSDREMLDMHEKNNAIQFLIENGEAIFFS
ncbi:hypothetical protein BDZ91DRAFT_800528 [Kalaharituber pfeilii]|nr:hypothetical protein BDZ91DRAFT_800528 [Kalaharituber pfeilii]